MQNQSACIGPNRGPVQAKMAENACKGPDDGPVRALREGVTWKDGVPPYPNAKTRPSRPGCFACTGNGTIIEPILMIFERCICLVIRWIMD